MAAAVIQQPSSAFAPAPGASVGLVSPATSPSPTGFGNLSLYVGDLDPNVNEGQLYDLFSQVAQVVSVRVCRDQTRRCSLGYAYVNFSTPQDAATAMDVLNFTPIKGRPVRIMFSQRDPSLRKSGYANVFIKNLDTSIDNKALYDTFAAFGPILSCKVATDNTGQSRGYGFVQFDREESAHNAIKSLNGMLLNDKQVYVGFFVRRQERSRNNGSPKFTNVYVKNLSENCTDDDLKRIFSTYGTITSAVVMRDGSGKSRCFGFVNFQSPESAAAAVENLNGSTHDDKAWYVGRAQRKSEREAELRAKFEQERMSRYEKMQGANLYLKNLDESITEEKLRELFSEVGTITSSKIMYDSHGVSKGSGFVSFSTPEEAARAINEMNGKMIGRKPLYVAVAQRKEERKARLQAHFAQVGVQGGMAAYPTGIHGYHPARIQPQQLYFGQAAAPPGLLPTHQPVAGYGFQHQMMPAGMRPGSVPPNFIMPYHLQRQPQSAPQRFGGGVRRGARNAHQMQQQQQQVGTRNSGGGGGHNYRYISNNGRNGMDASMGPAQGGGGVVGPMMPPMDASGMPMPMINTPDMARSMSTLASALAAASPESQRMMLGEQLYPLVEQIEAESAGKVTGMLLEMDQTEVLHLIESPDALKKKVAEAMDVLHSSDVDHHLSLSQ